jgi:hypothetical protein
LTAAPPRVAKRPDRAAAPASPTTATRSFVLPLPENSANIAWWLRLKGVRDIDTQWWRDLLEEHAVGGFGFDDLTATPRCCGRSASLTDLDYDWPCGFARFEIEIWNPDRDLFTDNELESVAQAIGHPVRQIIAHI